MTKQISLINKLFLFVDFFGRLMFLEEMIVETNDVAVTEDVGVTEEDTFTTQDYLLQTYLDDELDTTTSASSWVPVVSRRRRRPVVKQSRAVLTLFTKRK
jgi:hypothetical protein